MAGFSEVGPVVPRHPPNRLVLTTKYSFVSKALPGPIMPSHQPSPELLPVSRSSAAKPSRVLSAGGSLLKPAAWGIAAERVAHKNYVVPRGGREVPYVS